MLKQSVQFLRQLVDIPSPSGFEMRIQDVIRKRMRKYCAKVETDVCGNVIGVINPGAKTRVMLAGHCDEIGFMVTHIDSNGFIYFGAVGGIDPAIALAQRVIIHCEKGPVFGVIGRRPIHEMTREEMVRSPKLKDLWIDIGAKNRKDAEKIVQLGDYVTFDVAFREMRNGMVAAHGFDDRCGAFAVVETLRRLSNKKLNVSVYGVTSVQEEIGLRGARTSAFGIDPHVGIAVDVGHATDYPGTNPKQRGEVTLGKGPLLHRGPNMNPVLQKKLEALAKRKKMKVQIGADPRPTGTDANAMQITRAGVATTLISVPNRYMHTPVEVISLNDLDDTSKLLADFLVSLTGKESFVPRS